MSWPATRSVKGHLSAMAIAGPGAPASISRAAVAPADTPPARCVAVSSKRASQAHTTCIPYTPVLQIMSGAQMCTDTQQTPLLAAAAGVVSASRDAFTGLGCPGTTVRWQTFVLCKRGAPGARGPRLEGAEYRLQPLSRSLLQLDSRLVRKESSTTGVRMLMAQIT